MFNHSSIVIDCPEGSHPLTCFRSMVNVTYWYRSPLCNDGLCHHVLMLLSTALAGPWFLVGSLDLASQMPHCCSSDPMPPPYLQYISCPFSISPQVALAVTVARVATLNVCMYNGLLPPLDPPPTSETNMIKLITLKMYYWRVKIFDRSMSYEKLKLGSSWFLIYAPNETIPRVFLA